MCIFCGDDRLKQCKAYGNKVLSTAPVMVFLISLCFTNMQKRTCNNTNKAVQYTSKECMPNILILSSINPILLHLQVMLSSRTVGLGKPFRGNLGKRTRTCNNVLFLLERFQPRGFGY